MSQAAGSPTADDPPGVPLAGEDQLPLAPELPQPARLLIRDLVGGDRRSAEARLGDHARATSFPETAASVIQPAMAEIGRLWSERVLSVADEHLATATLESALVGLHRERTATGPRWEDGQRPRGLLACVQGNRHSLGLRVLGDLLEEDGWQVRLLGADVPPGALASMVASWEPEAVFLSVSLASQEPQARRTIEKIREIAPGTSRVLLGGMAVHEDPDLVERAGADAGPMRLGTGEALG